MHRRFEPPLRPLAFTCAKSVSRLSRCSQTVSRFKRDTLRLCRGPFAWLVLHGLPCLNPPSSLQKSLHSMAIHGIFLQPIARPFSNIRRTSLHICCLYGIESWRLKRAKTRRSKTAGSTCLSTCRTPMKFHSSLNRWPFLAPLLTCLVTQPAFGLPLFCLSVFWPCATLGPFLCLRRAHGLSASSPLSLGDAEQTFTSSARLVIASNDVTTLKLLAPGPCFHQASRHCSTPLVQFSTRHRYRVNLISHLIRLLPLPPLLRFGSWCSSVESPQVADHIAAPSQTGRGAWRCSRTGGPLQAVPSTFHRCSATAVLPGPRVHGGSRYAVA